MTKTFNNKTFKLKLAVFTAKLSRSFSKVELRLNVSVKAPAGIDETTQNNVKSNCKAFKVKRFNFD